jgi:hypothetical protein
MKKMDEPKLRDDFIKTDLYAQQIGRTVVLVDGSKHAVKDMSPLNEIEQRRLEDFAWRLNDAWREYDAVVAEDGRTGWVKGTFIEVMK